MKSLKIESIDIQFSANSKIEKGYFADLKIIGTLPGCRKSVKLTYTPMSGYVWIKPLFSGPGSANVSGTDWQNMIDVATVSVWEYGKITVTDQMIKETLESFGPGMIVSIDRMRASDLQFAKDHGLPEYHPKFDLVILPKQDRKEAA